MSELTSREDVARPAVIGAAIAAVLLAAFLGWVWALGTPALAAFDAAVGSAVHGLRSPALTAVALRVTDLGSAGVTIGVAVVVVAVALAIRQWRAAVFVAATLAVGYSCNAVAQRVVHRTRPAQASALIPLPGTFSFPSGHSSASLLVYGAIALLAWHGLKRTWLRVSAVAALVLVIAGVGLSRIYLGVHWPSDVVGAWLLGGAWLALLGGGYLSWERGAR